MAALPPTFAAGTYVVTNAKSGTALDLSMNDKTIAGHPYSGQLNQQVGVLYSAASYMSLHNSLLFLVSVQWKFRPHEDGTYAIQSMWRSEDGRPFYLGPAEPGPCDGALLKARPHPIGWKIDATESGLRYVFSPSACI